VARKRKSAGGELITIVITLGGIAVTGYRLYRLAMEAAAMRTWLKEQGRWPRRPGA
jgi:hypothetical protein